MPHLNRDAIYKWTATPVRLAVAAIIGVFTFVVSSVLESDLRILLAYDLAMSTYLTMLIIKISHSDEHDTREIVERSEPNNVVVLSTAAILSASSLAGVGLMLHRSRLWTPLMANLHLALSLAAVFLSWTLMHATFAIHYARLYYDPTPPPGEPSGRPPLEFPDDAQPDFWDFMYFAFTLAVCYQVSDVTIRSRHVRRVALAHMFLSFLSVTMILGLVIEIVSTLASPTLPSS